jgi:hypothetical protein
MTTPRSTPTRGPRADLRSGRRPASPVLAAALLVALAAGACTGGGATPATASASPSLAAPSASEAPSGLQVPSVEPGLEGVPQAIIDEAVADAAGRAGVDPSEVVVASTESTSWPNGALGCPEPGMMYTEVITPGYRVVVEAGGSRYDYRASARAGAVHWCENPLGPG